MPNLIEAASNNARSSPHKPFLIHWESGKYHVISNMDFYDTARSIADFLARKAPGADGVALLILKHNPLLHACYIACMMRRLVPSYLPFPTVKQDPVLYFANHRELLARTEPACIVTYTELIPEIRAVAPPGVEIIDIADYRHADHIEPAQPMPGDVALLQHSSGTTGLKKGVALTYGQIAAQAAAYAPVVGLTDQSVVVSWLPLYHDMGLFTSFLIPLSLGASVVSLDAFEWVKRPKLLLEVAALFGGTHTWLPNFAFNHIVNTVQEQEQFDLHGMQAFISCSEPVKPATVRRFVERFAASGVSAEKVQACYAMAEASFAVAQHPLDRPARIGRFDKRCLDLQQLVFAADAGSASVTEMVSNGPPINGIKVGIVAPDGTITTGEGGRHTGEIVVQGQFVFDRYYKNSDATQSAFLEGWYRTGDVGFLYDGELYICGRTKELAIVHGRNYYLHDVEEIVSTLPGVVPGRVVAIGIDDPEVGSEEVLILAETTYDAAVDDVKEAHKELRRAVKRIVFTQLELTPQSVDFVPAGWLVKTTSGKISRVENLRRYRGGVMATKP